MKKLLSIFLFLLFNCFSQENKIFFYQTCYNISKANKSDKEVEKYFKAKGKWQPKDYIYYYDIAIYFLDKKNFEKAYKYMSLAIQHGLC